MQTSGLPRWLRDIPPVTRNLIIINVLIWLAEIIIPGFGQVLLRRLGLHFWAAPDFNPAQLFTYMFLHDNHTFLHVFFNMFTLWMFGRLMEQVWGSKRFFIFYFVCGVGAALFQEVVWQLTWHAEWVRELAALNHVSVPEISAWLDNMRLTDPARLKASADSFSNMMLCVGASGAIFGILLGFAFVFPNMPLYLFFIPVPVKAKYMVIGYAVIEFFLGVSGTGGTVAHFAHLGGMLFGLILLLWWRHKGILRGNRFF